MNCWWPRPMAKASPCAVWRIPPRLHAPRIAAVKARRPTRSKCPMRGRVYAASLAFRRRGPDPGRTAPEAAGQGSAASSAQACVGGDDPPGRWCAGRDAVARPKLLVCRLGCGVSGSQPGAKESADLFNGWRKATLGSSRRVARPGSPDLGLVPRERAALDGGPLLSRRDESRGRAICRVLLADAVGRQSGSGDPLLPATARHAV